MPTPEHVLRSIRDHVGFLVEVGLAVDQNFPFRRDLMHKRTEVTFPVPPEISFAKRSRTYSDSYDEYKRERAYTVLMLDGAMLQLSYDFHEDALQRHRLAFLPSPYLDEFQNDPEVFVAEPIFSEIRAPSVVPFPFRFDFDTRIDVTEEIGHPSSHLTLGQYEHCRIPVSAPLTPGHFVEFVVRNFYHTDKYDYTESLPLRRWAFSESIYASERALIYVQIPS